MTCLLGVAIPYMRCQRLREMIVLIRKFDHPAGAGIAETIFHEIPGREDKLHKFERFLIRITGKNRLASLHRSWEKRYRPMMKDWMDPERGDRWLRMDWLRVRLGGAPTEFFRKIITGTVGREKK